ncbi:hypothetical protein [Sphingobacterium sp.]|uniref:hypothetical protein n=1 Tax=Sphingobacterium sp. TaxID=341027 RepID=UPI00289BF0A0|nr:hypothetical protein [Sphingobacterium sp.]
MQSKSTENQTNPSLKLAYVSPSIYAKSIIMKSSVCSGSAAPGSVDQGSVKEEWNAPATEDREIYW